MSLRRVLLSLLGLTLGGLALAPPVQAVTVINLTGAVTNTDGVDQDGVVCLELVGGDGSCGGTYLTDGSWTMTWTEGDNDPGDYLVRVISSTMDGTSRWYVAGNNNGTTDKALATPVHLAVGEPDFSFTMVMPAIAKVTGRVIDTSAVGVPGLPVLINEGGLVRSTTSGAGGSYDLGYTRAGTWQVTANGGSTYAPAQTAVVVPATGVLVVSDLVVQRPATVSGRVTDSVSGDPIPFIEVYAWQAADPHSYLGNGTTDRDGHYVIEGLGNTPLVLRFTDAAHNGYVRTLNNGGDPVTWSPQTPIVLAEEEAHVYDQALVAKPPPTPPAHNLSGTVTDEAHHPLPGIEVTFGDVSAVSDRLGHWYLDAPDGTHPLGFAAGSAWATAFDPEPAWAPESYPGRLVSPSPTPVTVTGGVGADNLDITLVRTLTSSAAPVITGVAAAGQTLTASQGTWVAPPATTFSTTWLRDGVPVATGVTYVVSPADSGRVLRARVTATHGLAVTQAVSAPRTVARLATTVELGGTSRRAGRVQLTVSVTAAGLTPTGTVVVLRGTKVVKSDVVLVDGRAVVKLRHQPAGRRRYSVTYSGTSEMLPATSPTVVVKVRKKGQSR